MNKITTSKQITFNIHNIPTHGNGELRFELSKKDGSGKEANEKHIDQYNNAITHMGRSYSTGVYTSVSSVHFCLFCNTVREWVVYVFECPLSSTVTTIDVDCLKDAKQITILTSSK